MLFRTVFSLFVFALFLSASPVQGQEELSALCESWSRCNKEMKETYKALNDGDLTPGLADGYRDLVDEANDLIKSMRKQAKLELEERPGDGQVIRTLLGIMVHDAQEGRDGMVLDSGQALVDAKVNPKYFEQAANIDRLELGQKHVFEELIVRHRETMKDDLPRVKLETTAGDIVLELFENEAPNTVRNFVSLVESGHYSNKLFHRVIENFMAQGGGFETEGIGSGGPGYEIECECKEPDARRNFTGTISMAHAGRDTGGSQFFLNFKYNKGLDRNHTVFGRIVSGMDVLDRIERTEITVNGQERPIEQAKPDKIVKAEVIRKRDHSYRVRKKGEPELPEEPEPKKEEAVEKEEPAEKEGEEESESAEENSEAEMTEKEKDSDKEPAKEEKETAESEKGESEEEAYPKSETEKEEPAKEEPVKEESSGKSESESDESAGESEGAEEEKTDKSESESDDKS
jgi:cyclophilin family peptidyl-prolyl cis-trans isomerase